MGTRVIPAGDFRANCFALLDEVAEFGDEILVTKNGRVGARVVPPIGYVAAATEGLLTAEGLLGSAHWGDDEDLIEPTGEPWPGETRDWPDS